MRIIIDRLTRMKAGHIGVAGLDDVGQHIRPVVDRRGIPVELLASNGGVFALGATVELGETTHVGSAPQHEDHLFEPEQATLVGDPNQSELWDRLQQNAELTLADIFGQDLRAQGRGAVVPVGTGRASLGTLDSHYRPKLLVDDQERVRCILTDPDLGELNLSVTDVRFYTQGESDWIPDPDSVRAASENLAEDRTHLVSVGLGRPWPRERPAHWLQVSAIHFEPVSTESEVPAYDVGEIRKTHPNAYRPWSEEDERLLKLLHERGMSVSQMSEILGRQAGGIRSRLKRLSEGDPPRVAERRKPEEPFARAVHVPHQSQDVFASRTELPASLPPESVGPLQYGPDVDQFEDTVLPLLRELTGDPNSRFRSGQMEAIRAIAEERSRALVVQRTGWGKSAVYLIATRLLRDSGSGPTVIVSPLLVLMRNQLEMTQRLGLNAATVNSTNRDDWEPTFDSIKAREVDLLLISPERLNNVEFRRDIAPQLFSDTGLLVIDEVHCISDWGHDFRPDYRRLRDVISALPPTVPVLGTTATANDRVVADVEEQLGSDLRVFRGTLERESLSLQVLDMGNKAERMAWLAEHIPNLSGCGIVYCLTIHDTDRVGEWLRANGIDAASYTGPLDPEARLEIEARLTAGDLKVVAATSALAMGYDNPLIEWVIHYQMPGSAIAYYQQVGRAGRAVDHSVGIGMSGWEDRDIQDYFINTAFPSEEDCQRMLDGLRQSEGGLRLTDIEELVNLRRSRIQAMLKILEVEGAVYKEGARWRRSAQRWEYPRARIEEVTAARKLEQKAMEEYVSTDSCLMEFLRRQLDDPGAEPCGRCANCVGPRFTPEVDPALVEAALGHIRGSGLEIKVRRHLPCEVSLDIDLREHAIEPGRCLTRWGDPGLARKVETGKYVDGTFDEELVEAAEAMISEWGPTPSPAWLTWVPSSTGRGLVGEFGVRLAGRLDIEPVDSLRRIRDSKPQKEMQNSCQQARNVAGAFEVVETRPGPVLLVDDMVDSRWTFTIVGAQLRQAGSGAVYPFALSDTSGGGA